jgi:hypothetical protein
MKKIVTFISDTHGFTTKLNELINKSLQTENVDHGDIIICSGDCMTSGYHTMELTTFLSWFSKLPYTYKVFTPGNHDRYLESIGVDMSKSIFETPEYFDMGVRYVQNELLELDFDGEILKLYGTGDQPKFCNWAFNRDSEELIFSYSNIPDGIDILITHCPPFGILDCSHVPNPYRNTTGEEHLGSEELLDRLNTIINPPKYHVFGHIHGDGGKIIEQSGITFINASVCDESYRPKNEIKTVRI